MSKYVKNLITDDLKVASSGVDDALLVNIVGLDANTNSRLRSSCEQEHPAAGGQEQPGPPGR